MQFILKENGKKNLIKNQQEKNIFIILKKYYVEFMESKRLYNYFENKDIQAISLSYKKDKMEAPIILPKNDYNINSYIENFNQK